MPSIKDESTVDVIARIFCGEGKRNKTETLRIAGYKPSYCLGGRSDKAVWGNERVIKAIQAIDAKTEQEMGFSRTQQLSRLTKAYDMANTSGSASAMTGAIREMNEMLGYHRDKAPNSERAQAIANRMTEQERAIAEEVARIITDREAGPKLKTG